MTDAFRLSLLEGLTPIVVVAQSWCSLPFRLRTGDQLRWRFIVLDYDLKFCVKVRRMGMGGAVEEEVEPKRAVSASQGVVEGSLHALETAQYIVYWDNSYSWLRPKHVAYNVEVRKTCVEESDAAETGAFNQDEFVGEIESGDDGFAEEAQFA